MSGVQSGSYRPGIFASLRAKFALAAIALAVAAAVSPAQAQLEERKLPMKFAWHACAADCAGWISAVGLVTADSFRDFDDFARGRDLHGATVVLDSSGGSVNDAIALGRRWRKLGLTTTIGTTITIRATGTEYPAIIDGAYCESMCVFLLLSGTTRYVPPAAHVRVHQIWMGDRADNAKASSYSAQDLMIVERDIGRLAKFTFDMGGSGDLLALALSVPPWEALHEMSRSELQLGNLVTTDVVPDVLKPADPAAVASIGLPQAARPSAAVAAVAPARSSGKSVQDRAPSDEAVAPMVESTVAKPTKTAEAH